MWPHGRYPANERADVGDPVRHLVHHPAKITLHLDEGARVGSVDHRLRKWASLGEAESYDVVRSSRCLVRERPDEGAGRRSYQVEITSPGWSVVSQEQSRTLPAWSRQTCNTVPPQQGFEAQVLFFKQCVTDWHTFE